MFNYIKQYNIQENSMSGIKLQNINMLYLLWLVPPLIAVYIYAWQKRRQAVAVFIDTRLHSKISMSVSNTKRTWKAVALISAIVFTIFAMTRPGWNPRPEIIERSGRDVVFLLDVSKSMLAEDLVPNRLERAKLAIRDCIDRLEGDRVGIVVFAGTAAVKCPLTLDYGFFRMMLDNISTDSVARGGTMVGDAVRKVMDDVFDDQDKEFKDIILITDGEDHDSFPVEAAKKAGAKGVRIIAIGLGDENEGKRIPVTKKDGQKTFLKYKGQEIWTKLDADTLRKMVNTTPGGKYLNVATGTIDLGNVYTALIRSAAKKKLESETIKRYEEKFQILLAFALIFMFIEMIINERKQEQKKDV
jgi:Ca-activated chloride channel family protein